MLCHALHDERIAQDDSHNLRRRNDATLFQELSVVESGELHEAGIAEDRVDRFLQLIPGVRRGDIFPKRVYVWMTDRGIDRPHNLCEGPRRHNDEPFNCNLLNWHFSPKRARSMRRTGKMASEILRRGS
jgi:hypothetical protein